MEVGKCGMPCGLCPMYHITTSGRCTGCSKERGCNIISCCTCKNVDICSECEESICSKITKMKEFPNYHTDKVWERNLIEIKKLGYQEWCQEYHQKMKLITVALEKYNVGRSKKLICQTFMMYDLKTLEELMEKAEQITTDDKKDRAKQFKNLCDQIAQNNV